MPIYLKIDGINTTGANGGITEATIELQSFSWGAANVNASSGGGAGKARRKLMVTKYADATSPQLFQADVKGTEFKNGVISLVPAVQSNANTVFAKYSFSDVIMTSMDFTGNQGGADLPLESLEFEFAGLSITLG